MLCTSSTELRRPRGGGATPSNEVALRRSGYVPSSQAVNLLGNACMNHITRTCASLCVAKTRKWHWQMSQNSWNSCVYVHSPANTGRTRARASMMPLTLILKLTRSLTCLLFIHFHGFASTRTSTVATCLHRVEIGSECSCTPSSSVQSTSSSFSRSWC